MDLNYHAYAIVLVNTRDSVFPSGNCPIGIGKSMNSLIYVSWILASVFVYPFFFWTQNVKTFKDVKGCDDAKQELEEVVEYLKNPAKFTRLGGKLPKVCAYSAYLFWLVIQFCFLLCEPSPILFLKVLLSCFREFF